MMRQPRMKFNIIDRDPKDSIDTSSKKPIIQRRSALLRISLHSFSSLSSSLSPRRFTLVTDCIHSIQEENLALSGYAPSCLQSSGEWEISLFLVSVTGAALCVFGFILTVVSLELFRFIPCPEAKEMIF